MSLMFACAGNSYAPKGWVYHLALAVSRPALAPFTTCSDAIPQQASPVSRLTHPQPVCIRIHAGPVTGGKQTAR